MSTKRLLVRDALIALIQTATGLAPYRNLDYALEDRNLPAIAVTSGSDAPNRDLETLDEAAVSARFNVAVLVAQSADPEAAADVFEAQIVMALQADVSLGGLAVNWERLGAEWDFDLGDCALRRVVLQINFFA